MLSDSDLLQLTKERIDGDILAAAAASISPYRLTSETRASLSCHSAVIHYVVAVEGNITENMREI